MQKLKRMLTRLSRLGHSRGFGIQSPTDYQLVRYVLCEQWPYYQYEELAKTSTNSGRWARRLNKLYFRLANWRQPSEIVDWQPQTTDAGRYMQAGCRKAVLHMCQQPDDLEACTGQLELMVLRLTGDFRAAAAWAQAHADNETVLVVEAPWRDENFWQELLADSRVTVTFDLYECGVVLFDQKRFRKDYKLNL